jgi:hypothetical protein
VRVLPSGKAGVVYGGVVYPLYAGNSVDVADDPHDKYDCRSFVPVGGTISYSGRSLPAQAEAVTAPPGGFLRDEDWHLEANRVGHYLVFDADQRTAERVVDVLERSPLGVRRWDAGHRSADNGRFYDWFVWLTFDGDRQECLRLVRSLLGRTTSPEAPTGIALEGSLPERLRSAIVEALQNAQGAARENTRLTQEISDATSQSLRVKQENEELRLHLDVALADTATMGRAQDAQVAAMRGAEEQRRADEQRALDRSRKLHDEQIAELRDDLAAARSEQHATLDSDRAELRARLAAAEIERDDYGKKCLTAEKRENELAAQLRSTDGELIRAQTEAGGLRDDIQRVTSHLDEWRNEDRERRTAERESVASRLRPNLERFLTNALSNCRMDDDSIEELSKFHRPGKALRELIRIDQDDPQVGSKANSIKGHPGWLELSKIHTGASGNSDMGRIYYKRQPDGAFQTIVHLKKDDKEQRRFFDRRLGG